MKLEGRLNATRRVLAVSFASAKDLEPIAAGDISYAWRGAFWQGRHDEAMISELIKIRMTSPEEKMAAMNPRLETMVRPIERMGSGLSWSKLTQREGAGPRSLRLISEHVSKRGRRLSCSSLRPKGLVFP